MRAILAIVIPAAVFVLAACLSAVALHRHRRQRPAVIAEPRSLVRLLTSEAELHEAVRRAERFELEVAASLRARTARYEAISPAKLRVSEASGGGEPPLQTRSA